MAQPANIISSQALFFKYICILFFCYRYFSVRSAKESSETKQDCLILRSIFVFFFLNQIEKVSFKSFIPKVLTNLEHTDWSVYIVKPCIIF